MTVHRVGPAPEEAEPHRTNLGRVEVTIDDLDALMVLLTRDKEADAAEIKVEFDGGYFTEAQELSTLSDMETKSLRLKTSSVQVVLNPTAAFALGDRREAQDVYRLWARARQTRLKSRQMSVLLSLTYIIILILVLAGILTGTLLTLLDTDPFGTVSNIINIVLIISLVAFYISIFFWQKQAKTIPSSYAVIVPMSLAEHRQSQSSQMYPRRSWIVAIIAAIIAAVSVGVAIWAVFSR